MSIQYQLFPKNKRITIDLQNIINIFETHCSKFDSKIYHFGSNDVLNIIKKDLENLGYLVEKGKTTSDKILVPVLYGINGQLEQRFEADAYNEILGIVIEVEAGRAITNYQFLKDLFEACVMSDVHYLVVAVRNIYRKSKDFEKVITFLNTLYASNRLQLPLDGILIIGY